MKLILPLQIWIPRKAKEDKLIYLNQNWYRTAHHFTSNQVKQIFKDHIEAMDLSPLPKGQYRFSYVLFPARTVDVMNPCAVIDKFVCDALAELGIIQDDNMKILPEFSFRFGGIDKNNPRCELEITPMDF